MENKVEKLKLDIAELEKLMGLATRKGVQDIISIQLSKVNTQLKDALEIEINAPKKQTSEGDASSKNTSKSYTVAIRNYSWDESEKFMKLYLTLKNIQSLNKDDVTSEFTSSGFSLKVVGLDGKDHELSISKLAGTVNTSSSYHKIKTDMIVVMIAKESPGKWEAVTAEDRKVKEAKKTKMDNSSKDPSAGLMDMMKQMYDDGDDNMKRMLNKSWYESQQKQGMGGMPGMGMGGGMPGMGMGGGMPGMGMGGGMPGMGMGGGMPGMGMGGGMPGMDGLGDMGFDGLGS